MSTTLKNTFVGMLAATLMFAAFAMPAKAQTVAELQALINQLMSQIAAMQGGSATTQAGASCTYVHSGPTMRVGSRGTQVMAMQNALNASGFSVGTADGAFGNMTAAGVRSFQAAKNLPVDGLFGNMSGAALANHCAASVVVNPGSPTTPTTPAGLTGQGTINDMSVGSSDESEMNEGDTDVEIYAVDVELDDNGDLMVQSVDVWFSETDGGGHSQKPWDYFSEVTLMVDGSKVASMDADSSSDWSSVVTDGGLVNQGNISTVNTSREYRMRFTGLNFVMESDETTVISVAVSSVNNIDSDDDGATWNVDLGDMRVVDGTGFMTNENYNVADSFSINSSAEEADINVRDSNDSPDAQVIKVHKTNDTNGVTIYGFEIREENNVDVNIEEMTLTFVTPGDENTIIKRAYIYQGSNKVGDESMTADGVVVFDNMDIDVDGNDTEKFTVRVDLEDTNNGARYAEGATISVSVTSIDLFTDANGNDEGDINESISGGGDTHELRTEGIMVELVSTTKAITSAGDPATAGSTDKGTFTIVFDVTGFGSDQRLDKTTAEGVAASVVAGQGVLFSTTADTVITSSLTSSTTDTEDNVNVFELDENQKRRFTLTVVAESTDDLAEVVLETINFGTATNNTNASFYTFNLDEFKTGELFLNTY